MEHAAQAMGMLSGALSDRKYAAAQQAATTATAGISVALERLQHLGFTTTDLAQRIGGPANELGGLIGEGKAPPQPNDLRSLVTALDAAISRVEINVQRALDHL